MKLTCTAVRTVYLMLALLFLKEFASGTHSIFLQELGRWAGGGGRGQVHCTTEIFFGVKVPRVREEDIKVIFIIFYKFRFYSILVQNG